MCPRNPTPVGTNQRVAPLGGRRECSVPTVFPVVTVVTGVRGGDLLQSGRPMEWRKWVFCVETTVPHLSAPWQGRTRRSSECAARCPIGDGGGAGFAVGWQEWILTAEDSKGAGIKFSTNNPPLRIRRTQRRSLVHFEKCRIESYSVFLALTKACS